MSPDARQYHEAVGVMAPGGRRDGPTRFGLARLAASCAMSTGAAGVFLYFVAHLIAEKYNT